MSLQELQQAESRALLWFCEIRDRRLYRELGCSSIWQYAQERLGFSKTRTAYFLRLAKSFHELPALRESVASGEITWTQAREVVKVATPRTEQIWIDRARASSRRELERQVARTRSKARAARSARGQGDLLVAGPDAAVGAGSGAAVEARPDAAAEIVEVPVSVTLRFTPEQFARWEAALARLQESGEGADREALALHAAETAAGIARGKVRQAAAGIARSPAGQMAGVGGGVTRTPARQGAEADVGGAGPSARQGGEAAAGVARRQARQGAEEESAAAAAADITRVNSCKLPRSKSLPKDACPVASVPVVSPAVMGRARTQIFVRLCPRCDSAHSVTMRGDLPLSETTVDRLLCDARVHAPGCRNTARIPDRIRMEVLERDGYRCRAPGCGRTRFVEVHHRVFRGRGGDNRPGNLVTLCSGCHSVLHDLEKRARGGRTGRRGRSPAPIDSILESLIRPRGA